VAGPASRSPALTRFPGFARGAGGYESYYLRAVDPERPRGVWLRHTIHKAPGEEPIGSTWLTLFDRDAAEPVTAKQSLPGPLAPEHSWVRIGDSEFRPDGVRGPDWDLTWTGAAPPLRHLPREWMYSAPLPRTKLESPLPAITVSGTVHGVEVDGWPGMIGHNWGAQHAERWIWLHGTLFEDAPDAWLDIALGRIKVAGRTTPWIANGVVCVGGERTRVGGPAAIRKTHVHEDPLRLDLELPGLTLTVHSPRAQTAVWRYADPDGSEHHTANCSIARMEGRFGTVRLYTDHGGTYELGMRETTHGLPVQLYPDP
jgi:hypothetical protein